MNGNARLEMRFQVNGNDFIQAGEASSKIKRTLQQIGIDSRVIRRVVISSYEAEMNITIHAYRGEILFTIWPNLIQIVAQDEGPGISDLEAAMQEGYSTAPENVRQMGFGAGMGLPNMKKNTDEMQIETEEGRGTRITMKIYL